MAITHDCHVQRICITSDSPNGQRFATALPAGTNDGHDTHSARALGAPGYFQNPSPGVAKEALDVDIENDVLRVEGRIDYGKYEGMDPLYTEYNVGHFARSFTLSNKIDQQQISAQLEDGVLTLTLKKAKEAMPRRIAISSAVGCVVIV